MTDTERPTRNPLRAVRVLVVALAVVAAAVVVPALPASAAPAWSVAASPSPAGPSTGGLAGVSCPSTTSCFAVGGQGDAPSLVERWNGANWSVMTSPNPTGSASSRLAGVSCVSTTSCFAVGAYEIDTNIQHLYTLIEHWNGVVWSIMTSPNPSTTAQFIELNGVSCTSTTSCVAVGDAHDVSSGSTLVEQWNGAHWTIVSAPNPSEFGLNGLNGVSCPSTTNCNAVGSYTTIFATNTLVEHWNGVSWSVVASPNPSGAIDPDLISVSCPSTTNCNAVGGDFVDPTAVTLVEHWDGTSWSIVSSTNASGGASTGLSGVSCPTTTNCTAVGDSFNQTGATTAKPFAERWNGTTWTIVATPDLGVASNAGLFGVSCPTATVCDAVGGDSSSGFTVVEQLNGASWSVAAPPLGSSESQLVQVSCPSTTTCFAVGHDLPVSSAGDHTLVERWNGTTWSVVASPNPSGATSSDLVGVACASTTNCSAVGQYLVGSTTKTLAEHWNGTTWSVVASPNPSGATDVFLSGVSCPSTASCFAVGYSFTGTTDKALIEHWNGKGWSIVASPTPSGATDVLLEGVSCPSATRCTAVGYSDRSDLSSSTLVERWNGASWSVVTSPNPSGAGGADLMSVSCPSTTSCTAVGEYDGNSGPRTLAEHWNGTAWSIVASPTPSGTSIATLRSASCPSTTSCFAVGDFYTNGSPETTLIEHWNGTSWSIVSGPNPGGAGSRLSGVSCRSTTNCEAVGDYGARASDYTLVERYA